MLESSSRRRNIYVSDLRQIMGSLMTLISAFHDWNYNIVKKKKKIKQLLDR